MKPIFVLGAFALVALLLAVIGVYGVIAYLVAQRSHEIGIRMALGAQRADVVRLVGRRVLGATAAGVTIGLVTAAAASHVMTKLLFDVTATDLALNWSTELRGIGVRGSRLQLDDFGVDGDVLAIDAHRTRARGQLRATRAAGLESAEHDRIARIAAERHQVMQHASAGHHAAARDDDHRAVTPVEGF